MNDRYKPFSITLRFIGWILPWAVLGIFLTGVSAFFVVKPYLFQNAQNELHTLGVEASRTISTLLRQHVLDAQNLSETPLFADYFNNRNYGLGPEAEEYRHEIEKYFARFREREKDLAGLWLLDAKGRVVATARSSEGAFFSDQDLHALVANTQPWSILETSWGPQLAQTKPLFHAQGRLLIVYSLQPVLDVLEAVEHRSNLHAFLMTPAGKPVFSFLPVPSPVPKDEMQQTFDIPTFGWSMGVVADRKQLLKPLVRIQFITLFFCIISALTVGGMIIFHIRRLLRPIQQLKLVVDKLSAGETAVRVIETHNDEIGSLFRSFYAMTDALQKKQAQVAHSELVLRTTLNASLDPIIGLNSNFHILTWNRGAEQLFGFEQSAMIGKDLYAILPSQVVESLVSLALQEGVVSHFEAEIITRAGKKRLLHITLAGAAESEEGQTWWTLVLRDVTEEKTLQEQLFQAEKLSVVGQLLSGVAHEINNPLTTVIGFAELLAKGGAVPPDEMKHDLEMIHGNALRCRDIVGNLLRFVRKSTLQKRRVLVNDSLEGVLRLMEYRLVKKEFVEVKKEFDPAVGLVVADSQQLEQVFLNLIQNACDAMGEQKGPKQLAIRTFAHKDGVRIEISDNGPGIIPAVQARLFEPFFTTKEEGKGTGLGLAISLKIITDHQGSITVKSDGRRGTTFAIELPLAAAASPAPVFPTKELPPAVPKQILIVDDEKDILQFIRRVLELEGHRITAVETGREALDELKRRSFDVVVCDLSLADMKGQDLPKRLREAHAALPIFLFITGDLLASDLLEELKRLGAVLQKPFDMHELNREIHDLCSPALNPDMPAGRHEGLDAAERLTKGPAGT